MEYLVAGLVVGVCVTEAAVRATWLVLRITHNRKRTAIEIALLFAGAAVAALFISSQA